MLAFGIFPRIIERDSKGDIVSSRTVYARRTAYFGGSRKKGQLVHNPEIGPGEEE